MREQRNSRRLNENFDKPRLTPDERRRLREDVRAFHLERLNRRR